MASKAIAITRANVNHLKARFEIEDVTEPIEVGYFLVKDFGSSDRNYELVTKQVLLAEFNILGNKLENGFFEVEKK